MAELNSYEPADIEIHLKDKGMVLKEKSLVAFTKSDGKILAIGKEAEEISRKNIEDVQVISPLRRGMIADYTVASGMFRYMVEKTWGKRMFRKPHIAVCVPKGRTEVETKALDEVMYFASAGAKEITVYEGDLEEFMEGMRAHQSKQYAAYDIFISISKNEPEKYISEELANILKYAEQQGIPVTKVEELLQEEEERI
ncbi:MAG: rod shape-determining protein [Lachnospiraceae bacterium]|nr:rod shape-determining protein [Lachnospiraceae bacterium]